MGLEKNGLNSEVVLILGGLNVCFIESAINSVDPVHMQHVAASQRVCTVVYSFTLLHLVRPKLYGNLAILSAIKLNRFLV